MALEHGMIEPFEDRQVRQGVVSYGVSSYGYDCRVGNEFKVFTNVYNTVVDPKNFDPKSFVDITGDECIVPPNSFALASTVEYFRIPRDVPDGLPGQVHLRALRHHRQRHAVRARVGRARDDRDLEHDAAAGEDLRQRRHRAGAFLQSDEPCEISYKDKKGQVSGAARGDAAEDLVIW
jgi:dCTP deaminase